MPNNNKKRKKKELPIFGNDLEEKLAYKNAIMASSDGEIPGVEVDDEDEDDFDELGYIDRSGLYD